MSSSGRLPDFNGENGSAESSHRYRRAELRARLAAERAELLCSLLGIEVGVLEDQPLPGTTSAAGLLNAVAAREESFAAELTRLLESSQTEANAEMGAESFPDKFEESLSRCVDARTTFLDVFARVPDDVVFAEPDQPGKALSPLTMATQCHWSDASLSLRASTWSLDSAAGGSIGPASLLRAAVRAARKDLLTTVALVPAEARDLALFDGGQTLPQIFRQIVTLERTFLEGLAPAGIAPPADNIESAETGDDQWKRAWSDLHTTHAALIRVLDSLGQAEFAAAVGADERSESVYMWTRGCLLHDRLYGAHIRAVLELDWPERLLR